MVPGGLLFPLPLLFFLRSELVSFMQAILCRKSQRLDLYNACVILETGGNVFLMILKFFSFFFSFLFFLGSLVSCSVGSERMAFESSLSYRWEIYSLSVAAND